MHAVIRISLFAVVCLLAGCGTAPPIALKDMGSFHIGGRDVEIRGKTPVTGLQLTPGVPADVDPNGTYNVEQMYVQYFIPSQQKGSYPLLLWHGAWLTGATYETTPDGREGWANYFLKHGWPVYLSDAVERGRAGWAMFPDVYTSDPLFLTKENAFARFRIGVAYDADPAKRELLDGNQFPQQAYDQFAKQAVPRWTTNNKPTIAAYIAEVDKVCPCVILVHSQSGLFGAAVAEARPDKVKGLIMVEPANGGDIKNAALLKNTPILAVYGDYIEQDPRWSKIKAAIVPYYDAIRAAGGSVDVLDLPKAGQHGNSHMIMMDKNSDQVAGLIQDWLARKGLVH
jgi:pimeloyl-ACP methyl ester carboxylesterase